MVRATVIFSPAAESDLDDIWYHIALDNPSAADRTIDKLRQRLEQLTAFPESGRARPDIAPNARSLTVGNHIALYRLSDRGLEIVRVVHGARDLTDLF